MVERRTIPEYLCSDEEEEELSRNGNGTSSTTPTSTTTTTTTMIKTPESCHDTGSTNPFRRQMDEEEKLKRNRRRSVHKKIREQQSIDDDVG